jgi:hypothetical protein
MDRTMMLWRPDPAQGTLRIRFRYRSRRMRQVGVRMIKMTVKGLLESVLKGNI